MPQLYPVFAAIGKWLAANWVMAAITVATTAYSFTQAAAAKKAAKRAMEDMYNAGRRVNVRLGPTEARNYIYGTCRVGGTVAASNTTGDKGMYFNRLQIIADHPIDSWEHVYMESDIAKSKNGVVGGKWISGSITYFDSNVHTGESPIPDSTVVSWFDGDITNYHRFTSCSYFVSRYRYDKYQNVWPQGPIDATIVVNGKRIYDPRDGTTVWSENPALCILDYLRSYLKVEDVYIDFDSFIEAANDCDTPILLASSFTRTGCDIEAGNYNIDVTPNVNAMAGIYVGIPVTGPGIPAGTRVDYVHNEPGVAEYFSIDKAPTLSLIHI